MLRSVFLGLALSGAIVLPACNQQTATSGPVTVTGKANIGGPFELVNQDGEVMTFEDIKGKPQLIYFGFSYCPDVCPMALQQIGMAQEQVDPEGEFFQPIFFSVDPERDTPESLKLYITANGFPKNLIGLTGTPEQVEAAKKAYKIYAQKSPDPDLTGGYTMDHVSLIYLMDKNGDFVDVFTHNSTVPEIVARLKRYKKTGA